jgi:hypothetical protein
MEKMPCIDADIHVSEVDETRYFLPKNTATGGRSLGFLSVFMQRIQPYST